IECIEEKRAKEKNKIIKEFSEEQDLKILNGRYGPYISYKKKNTAIPRNMDAKSLTLEECHKLIKAGNQKKKR
ncbi:MAG: topoisomerase C-terminal repeat-containing protein, partial [Candidatus Marinimicrobia bacterium]|nr:topoisomerase C-terminal repeat-containing protein [Candidatus Neomarinimicrobiota bacterium]